MSQCRTVLSRHVTEINNLEYAQKKNKQIADDTWKGRHVEVWWSWSSFSCNFKLWYPNIGQFIYTKVFP